MVISSKGNGEAGEITQKAFGFGNQETADFQGSGFSQCAGRSQMKGILHQLGGRRDPCRFCIRALSIDYFCSESRKEC